jgi:hypothetical protein
LRLDDRLRCPLNRVDVDVDQPQCAHPGASGHQEVGVLPCPQRNGKIVVRQPKIERQTKVTVDPAGQINRHALVVVGC